MTKSYIYFFFQSSLVKNIKKKKKSKKLKVFSKYTQVVLSQTPTLDKIITVLLNSMAQFLLSNPCTIKLCSGLYFGTNLNWAPKPKLKR